MIDSHYSVSCNGLDAGRYQRFSGATLGRQGEQQRLLLRLILMGDWCDSYSQPAERKNGRDSTAVRGKINAIASRRTPRHLDILS
jgi:hypothetical protein